MQKYFSKRSLSEETVIWIMNGGMLVIVAALSTFRISSLNLLPSSNLPYFLLALVAYLVHLAVYRVWFHPLAKFPGPKLAAITTWYQAYYDIWKRGQYVWRIGEMHEKYGPIVRINPHEIHILDPDYIDEVYPGGSSKRDRFKFNMGKALNQPLSLVGTIPHELHRKRRAELSRYFSKASIRRLEPVVSSDLQKLLERMDTCAKSGEVMSMTLAYKATTCDIITKYLFGAGTKYLDEPDFNSSFFGAIQATAEISHLLLYVGWLGPLIDSLPLSVQAMMVPGLQSFFTMKREWARQIEEIRNCGGTEETIFQGLLSSASPESEKATVRLQQEASELVLAGEETTAQSLAVITYHLLANPDKLKKLKEELATALPELGALPTCAQVERLPYLTAVIQEGIRIQPGVSMRLQRVSPEMPLNYYDKRASKSWTIPAGTPVSMDALSIHMHQDYFPEPDKFLPERWIENPKLERYSFGFSRGSRMCLGINLAYQELYLVLAGVFRKYDLYDGTGKQQGPTLALYETERKRDIDPVADMIVPVPSRGSRGVRVKVR